MSGLDGFRPSVTLLWPDFHAKQLMLVFFDKLIDIIGPDHVFGPPGFGSRCISGYVSLSRAALGVIISFDDNQLPQTVLALRGSDGFSKDPWRVGGAFAELGC